MNHPRHCCKMNKAKNRALGGICWFYLVRAVTRILYVYLSLIPHKTQSSLVALNEGLCRAKDQYLSMFISRRALP